MSIFESDPVLKRLREEAAVYDEYAATQFFLHLFYRHIFLEPNWVIGTEVPPRSQHNQTRMDIAVRYYPAGGHGTLAFRLVGQGKKGRAPNSRIAEAETQAYQLSVDYMINHGINSVWVITYFGSKARLWACLNDESYMLYPFYPFNGDNGDKKAYRDILEHEDDFLWAFDKIKEIAEPNPDQFSALYKSPDDESSTEDQTNDDDDARPLSQEDESSMDVNMEAGPASGSHRTIDATKYTSVQVTKVSKGWTNCTVKKNNTQIQVQADKWQEVVIIDKNNNHNWGFVAELSKNWYRTLDDPTEKGKITSHS